MNKWLNGDQINHPCKRILNKLCRYTSLEEVEHNSLLKCRLHIVTSFSRGRGWEGWKKRSFKAEKTDSHYFLAWQSKLPNHVHTCTPSIWWDENGSSSLCSSSQNPPPQSNHEVNIKQIPARGIIWYIWRHFQTCQSHQKQSWWNCHNQDKTSKWNVVSRMGFWSRKRTGGKKKKLKKSEQTIYFS